MSTNDIPTTAHSLFDRPTTPTHTLPQPPRRIPLSQMSVTPEVLPAASPSSCLVNNETYTCTPVSPAAPEPETENSQVLPERSLNQTPQRLQPSQSYPRTYLSPTSSVSLSRPGTSFATRTSSASSKLQSPMDRHVGTALGMRVTLVFKCWHVDEKIKLQRAMDQK